MHVHNLHVTLLDWCGGTRVTKLALLGSFWRVSKIIINYQKFRYIFREFHVWSPDPKHHKKPNAILICIALILKIIIPSLYLYYNVIKNANLTS